jgi:nucleotide-binding universal stress UspA family protein
MARTVDVLINGMDADLLVCMHHQSHFEQLFGANIPSVMPEHITVPVLVFPC